MPMGITGTAGLLDFLQVDFRVKDRRPKGREIIIKAREIRGDHTLAPGP